MRIRLFRPTLPDLKSVTSGGKFLSNQSCNGELFHVINVWGQTHREASLYACPLFHSVQWSILFYSTFFPLFAVWEECCVLDMYLPAYIVLPRRGKWNKAVPSHSSDKLQRIKKLKPLVEVQTWLWLGTISSRRIRALAWSTPNRGTKV